MKQPPDVMPGTRRHTPAIIAVIQKNRKRTAMQGLNKSWLCTGSNKDAQKHRVRDSKNCCGDLGVQNAHKFCLAREKLQKQGPAGASLAAAGLKMRRQSIGKAASGGILAQKIDNCQKMHVFFAYYARNHKRNRLYYHNFPIL